MKQFEQGNLYQESEGPIRQERQTKQQRKDRINKNRAIRKGKVQAKTIIFLTKNQKQEIIELSQLQKKEIVKLKNRQAAQKSRDAKKQYLQSIEKENQSLKHQLENQRYCAKCKRQLSKTEIALSASETATQHHESSESDSNHILINEEINNEIDLGEEESEFTRQRYFENNDSFAKFLFILMVIVCAFGFFYQSSPTDLEPKPTITRALMEINIEEPTQSESKIKQQMHIPKHASNQNLYSSIQPDQTADLDAIEAKNHQNGLIPVSKFVTPSPVGSMGCFKRDADPRYLRYIKNSNNFQDKLLFCGEIKTKISNSNSSFLEPNHFELLVQEQTLRNLEIPQSIHLPSNMLGDSTQQFQQTKDSKIFKLIVELKNAEQIKACPRSI